MGFPINPPNTPLVDPKTGLVTREWYRFFREIQNTIGGAASPFDDAALLTAVPAFQGRSEEVFSLTPPVIPQAAEDMLAPPPAYVFVTSVNVSGGATGLTFSGGPVTSSGSVTMGGTLAVASGGTGATTASAARTNLGLGTAAVKDIGTTGATVGLMSTANAWSGVQDFSAGLRGSGAGNPATGAGTEIGYFNPFGYVQAFDRSGSAYIELRLIGSPVTVNIAGTEVANFTASGVNVTGKVQCDSLQIDAALTAETITPTHTLTISVDGVNFKLPLVAA